MPVNLPTTNPLWIEQRILDGQEITSEEQKISEKQVGVLQKTLDILNQPVQKNDTKGAQARANALKEHFASLPAEMKEYMYGILQTDMGRKDLSEVFRGKLSSESRDTLLKVLNPDHKSDHIKNETVKGAKSKFFEKSLEGLTYERKLQEYLKLLEEAHNTPGPMTQDQRERLEKLLKTSHR